MKRLCNVGKMIYIPISQPLEFGRSFEHSLSMHSLGSIIADAENLHRKRYENLPLKTIPDEIEYSSLEDRVQFIRGAMYSEATVEDKDGMFRLMFIDKCNAEKFVNIVRSVGGVAKIHYITKPQKYKVKFCFNESSGFKKHSEMPKHSRYVKTIRKNVDITECRCISISGLEQLYITDDFLVTHNSYIGSSWLVSSCIRFPGIRAVVARKTIKSLKESTFITIKKVLKEWGLKEDENFCINNVENTITFWNESVIMMKEMADLPGDADFSRFGSMECTLVFVDEASEISERAADVMFSRIRWKTHETFKTPKMFLSCNPAACWLRSRFVQDDDGNLVECREGEKFVRFSIFDNPDDRFRRIYEASLNKIKDQATKERLLYGNWDFVDANEMCCYKSFSGDIHLVNGLKETVYDPMKPLILGFDFNVFPYMSCLLVQIDYDSKNISFL